MVFLLERLRVKFNYLPKSRAYAIILRASEILLNVFTYNTSLTILYVVK